jgi:hypothetical protein
MPAKAPLTGGFFYQFKKVEKGVVLGEMIIPKFL